MNRKRVAVIVAGGRGVRMGGDKPKQFLEVAGRPILMHTIQRFAEFDNNIEIIVVLPDNQIDEWKCLCDKHSFKTPHSIVKGGDERFHSVKNGLFTIKDDNSIVAIHDGVRPMVSNETLQNCYESVDASIGIIPTVPLIDSIRHKLPDNKSKHADRNEFCAVQTPQVFITGDLKKAYNVDYQSTFTDDASVFENNGGIIKLVDGNPDNIKITTPKDLLYMELTLQSKYTD